MLRELEEFHVGLEDLRAVIQNAVRGRNLGAQDSVSVAVRISEGNTKMAVFLERFRREKAAAVNTDVLNVGFVRRGLSQKPLLLDHYGQVLMKGAVYKRHTHLTQPLCRNE